MTESAQSPRTRRSWWADRLMIICLGVSIGLAAKWIKQNWPASNASQAVPAANPATNK